MSVEHKLPYHEGIQLGHGRIPEVPVNLSPEVTGQEVANLGASFLVRHHKGANLIVSVDVGIAWTPQRIDPIIWTWVLSSCCTVATLPLHRNPRYSNSGILNIC